MNLVEVFRKIILANELDGSTAHAYKFSDADGINNGKSGYSFGICQMDINNNPTAIHCLRECGFTTDEIAGLKRQNVTPLAPFNAKLKAAAAVIDRYDAAQLQECLTVPLQLCQATDITFTGDEAKLHLADYHNQFYMSRGGKMHTFLLALKRPVERLDILVFRQQTLWGKKRPDDVRRRYDNIVRIYAESA